MNFESSRLIPSNPVFGGHKQGQNRDKFSGNNAIAAATAWRSIVAVFASGVLVIGMSIAKQLIPKHPDGVLRVIALGRLSKPKATEDETEETIRSSIAVVKAHLNEAYDGEMELKILTEQESGQVADRATILEAEELVAGGNIDLVIAEDLSRIFRTPRHQYVFVEDCVDAGVRVICVADRLDTANEDWESTMQFASFRHSTPIYDARRRQSRKNIDAFHNGGNVQKIRFGYRKLSREESKSGEFGQADLRMARVPEATKTIKEMREILMKPVLITPERSTYSYVPLLQWLNENKIPTGPYVTSGMWTQRLVKNLLSDPILIGYRRFRVTRCERIRRTGRFRRFPNPVEPEKEYCPDLAHLTNEEFETMQEVIKQIAESNSNNGGPEHPLYRKPREDAVFPRQHATCSICGGLMYAYDGDQLKCQNAHGRGADQCWNHVQVDESLALKLFIQWFISHVNTIPWLRAMIVDFSVQQLGNLKSQINQGGSSRKSTIKQLEKERNTIAKAIRKSDKFESLLNQLVDIENRLADLRKDEQVADAEDRELPPDCSPEGVANQLDDVLLRLAGSSFEFASLMREILPHFEIVPVQAIDSGLVRPRLRFTLSVNRLCKTEDSGEPIPDVRGELDLFVPPKSFRFVEACLEVKRNNPKFSYIKIADTINQQLAAQRKECVPEKTISYMTVKRCFGIARQMEAEGLSDPYRVLSEKPKNASRWKHRNSKSDDAA